MVQRNDDPNVIEGEVIETEVQPGQRQTEVITSDDINVLFAEEDRQMVPADEQQREVVSPARVTLQKPRTWGERRPPQNPPVQPPEEPEERQIGGRPARPISDEELGDILDEPPAQPRQGGGGEVINPGSVTLAKPRTWGL